MPSTEAEASQLAEAIALALDHLERGGLVAFPTETTWGLAASARSPRAVDELRAFKGRDPSLPISVIISSPMRLDDLGCEVAPQARAWADALWPGPLTLVLPCRADSLAFAPGVLNRSGGLGVRCSPHPVATALARGAEARGFGPLTATSCNASGAPPARSRAEARAVCGTGAAAPHVIAVGPDAGGEAPSTVVELVGGVDAGEGEARVLRGGPISKQRLREIVDASGIERAPGAVL